MAIGVRSPSVGIAGVIHPRRHPRHRARPLPRRGGAGSRGGSRAGSARAPRRGDGSASAADTRAEASGITSTRVTLQQRRLRRRNVTSEFRNLRGLLVRRSGHRQARNYWREPRWSRRPDRGHADPDDDLGIARAGTVGSDDLKPSSEPRMMSCCYRLSLYAMPTRSTSRSSSEQLDVDEPDRIVPDLPGALSANCRTAARAVSSLAGLLVYGHGRRRMGHLQQHLDRRASGSVAVPSA